MVWWLGIPVAAWAGKKIYDAVTSDSDSSSNSHDYEKEARKKERRARKEFARMQARLTLRGYLQGQGIDEDMQLECWVKPSKLRSDSERADLVRECMARFEQTPTMCALADEIEDAKRQALITQVAISRLKLSQVAYSLGRKGGTDNVWE